MDDMYYNHRGNIAKIVRETIEEPIERIEIEKIIKYSGFEASLSNTIKRMRRAVSIIEKYEKQNKLQAKSITKVGFNIS